MKPNRSLSFLLLLLVLVLSHSVLFAAQQLERKKVLVLYSFRPTLPIASQWDRGIRSVFESSTSYKVVVNIEHMDLRRFDEDRYIHLLLDVYRYKYSKPKPD